MGGADCCHSGGVVLSTAVGGADCCHSGVVLSTAVGGADCCFVHSCVWC